MNLDFPQCRSVLGFKYIPWLYPPFPRFLSWLHFNLYKLLSFWSGSHSIDGCIFCWKHLCVSIRVAFRQRYSAAGAIIAAGIFRKIKLNCYICNEWLDSIYCGSQSISPWPLSNPGDFADYIVLGEHPGAKFISQRNVLLSTSNFPQISLSKTLLTITWIQQSALVEDNIEAVIFCIPMVLI